MKPSPSHHIRFLDFPREVRNQVYEELLCRFQDKRSSSSNARQKVLPVSYPALDDMMPKSSVETAILRANHQTHAEAMEVFIIKNKFVRLFTRGISIGHTLHEAGIRVLTRTVNPATNSTVRDVHIAAMSYHLTSSYRAPAWLEVRREQEWMRAYGADTPYGCDLIILGSDLPVLVRAMWNGNSRDGEFNDARIATLPEHRLVLHNPFQRLEKPRSDVDRLHRALIDPCTLFFRGFAQLTIEGDVDPQLVESWTAAANLKHEVSTEKLVDPTVFLAEVTTHEPQKRRK